MGVTFKNEAYAEQQRRWKIEKILSWITPHINKLVGEGMDFLGHSSDYHLNAHENDLIERAVKERKHSSSFYGDSAAVQSLIEDVLLDAKLDVAKYLADEKNTKLLAVKRKMLPYSCGLGRVTGTGIFRWPEHDWDKGPLPCDQAVVVVRKRKDDPNQLVLVTAYPTRDRCTVQKKR